MNNINYKRGGPPAQYTVSNNIYINTIFIIQYNNYNYNNK